MIIIHRAILGQKLCKEIAHDILFKSHPFQSVRKCSFASRLEATTNLPPHIRMRWALYILDKCEHSDHWIEEKTSTETFLTLRDCIVNFWNSQFERFNGGINYEIVISLVH